MYPPRWQFSPFLLAVAVFFVSGCASDPYGFRVVYATSSADLDRYCGPSPLRRFGCAISRPGGCVVVALAPRGFDDRRRLETLGHEVLHCTHGPVHF